MKGKLFLFLAVSLITNFCFAQFVGGNSQHGCIQVQVPGRSTNITMDFNAFKGMRDSGVSGIYGQGMVPCPVSADDITSPDELTQNTDYKTDGSDAPSVENATFETSAPEIPWQADI